MINIRSIQFQIPAAILLVGAALIAFAVSRQFARDVNVRMESLRLDAFEEGTRLSGLAQHLFRKNLLRTADLVMSYASVSPELELGLICDGEDVVRHATQMQWRGKGLSATPLAGAKTLATAVRETMEGRVDTSADGALLLGAFPFWDSRRVTSKGVVLLRYDLERAVAHARRAAWQSVIAPSLALMAGCLSLWLTLDWLVTRRVAAVVKQAKAATLNALPEPPLAGDNELAEVSRSIHETVQRLAEFEQRFSRLASTMRDVFWIAPAAPGAEPFVNASYQQFWGRDPRRLGVKRWDWLKSVLPDERRSLLEALRDLRLHVAERDVEFRLGTGGARWLRCRAFSVAGARAPHDVAGIVMDVTEQKDIERRIIEAAENERRRIGQDLHDDLCQRLAAAQLKTGVLHNVLAQVNDRQSALAGEVAEELGEAAGIARSFSRGLAPVSLDQSGLEDALEEMAQFLAKAFHICCAIDCPDVHELLPSDRLVLVFRVAQELATNAAKHAGPSWIQVKIGIKDGGLQLQVIHDGTAFEPSRIGNGGMGLRIMKQRLDALSATLTYSTLKGHPPRNLAVVEIPLGMR